MKKQLLSILGVMALALTMTFTSCDDDPCKDVDCLNGGVCLDGLCDCSSTGYEGALCTDAWKDKYFGSYAATETCVGFNGFSNVNGTYSIGITASTSSPAAPDVFKISNFGGVGANAECTANGDGTFSIPTFSFSGFTFAGNGSITGNNVTIDYSLTDDSTGLLAYECTVTAIK